MAALIFKRRIERRLARAVGHELDAPEEAAAADVAHMRVAAECLGQHGAECHAVVAHLGNEAVAPDHLLHRERRRAGHRMAEVGVAVLEEAAALRHGIDDLSLRQHRANRLVATAKALGNGHEVGHHALLLAGVQRARAAHAAHHFIEDQQHAIFVAHRAHGLEVARHRREHTGRGAAHCFGHEGDYAIGALRDDGSLELGREAQAVLLGAFIGPLLAVRVARRNVRGRHQDGRERFAPPCIAAHRKRAQRVAVVALAARDEVRALRLADFYEVLPRHLERRFHRLGAAAHQVHMAHAFGRR